MSAEQRELMERALRKYDAIRPCAGSARWEQCFTRERNRVYFWFNTEDNSTHIEVQE